MYNEHDRPSTVRMIATAAGVIGGIAALIAVAAIAFGTMAAHTPAPTSAPAPSVQAPATATAGLPEAQPARTPELATASVAGGAGSTPTTPSTTAKVTATAITPTRAGLGPVVIDAGHQGHGDSALEPIGPGSSTKKAKVESGATGVVTHVEESQRNLEVALALQKVLLARGVSVVMVRTTQNVDIANSQRAAIANRNHAALFIRLHCDSAAPSVSGILTLRPEKNWYPGIDIVGPSAIAAQDVQSAVLAATGAKDRGIAPRSDLSGFNWSQVPTVLVEMGLLSNPDEDRKLATPAYQQQLANGMANGIVKFLQSR